MGLIKHAVKRHRLDVITDILTATLQGKRKTHLMAETRLSYDRLGEMLDVLKERGLVEEVDDLFRDRVFFVTTDEGQEYISKYKQIQKLLRDK